MQSGSRGKAIIAVLVIVAIVVSGLLGYYFSTLVPSSGINQTKTSSVTTASSPIHQTSSVSKTPSQATTLTGTTSTYPDSYYWSMPMMNGIANYTWMSYPTQTVDITQAVLLMKNPPNYVTPIQSNDTVQFHSDNITILVFGMMPEDAENLTSMAPPSYSTDDVFVIYGLINPTLVMPSGAQVQVIFVNLDSDMYHNFVFSTISPPYSNYPMQGMMGGGGMMGGETGVYGNYMMPYLSPANYGHGIAEASSFDLTLGSQTTLWYICSYPDHAQSGMYGKIVITGSIQSSSTTQTVGSGSVKSFTIYVSYLGFNGTSGNLNLNVKQGDSVSIKFIWNDTGLGFDNAHQLEVQGYGVISAVIDQELPISVIQFTASKAGSFQINCIIPCLGMGNLQNGWLIVAPS